MQEKIKIKIPLANGSYTIQCDNGLANITQLGIKLETRICGEATLIVYRCKATINSIN